MPQGKHNKKSSSAKKKGKQSRLVPSGPTSDGAHGASHSTATTVDDHNMGRMRSGSAGPVPHFPSFDAIQAQRRSSSANSKSPSLSSQMDSDGDSLYVRYKKSTQRIKDVLQSMVPDEIFQTDSVNAYMEATDYIVENNMEVDAGLLSDLKLSIRVRRRIAEDKYGGGDDGHSHFIAVLVYCWSHLLPHREKRVIHSHDCPLGDQSKIGVVHNRFGKLAMDDDTDSGTEADDDDGENNDEDDDGDLPQGPQPRPKETVPTRLTEDQLISGSDRTNCILFLMTLDELMGNNAMYFRQLQEASTRIQKKALPPSSIVQLLMEASVAANTNIQQVASLEEVFNRENPHLNTVYRVFACLVMANFTEILTELVTQKSPIASEFSEKDAIEFLGDAMECAYRIPSDPYNKQASLVQQFLKRWRFQDNSTTTTTRMCPSEESSVQEIFSCTQSVAMLEGIYEMDQHTMAMSFGFRPHSWLRLEFIGANRSITQTIRHLQCTPHSIAEFRGRMGDVPKGMFGSSWGDRKKPVSKIPWDMDDLLMRDILPRLINICYEGSMSKDLPHYEALLTGFVHLRTLIDHPSRAVSWSLAFTVHTILTGIFETQASNHAAFLAETARLSFEKYVEQLEWVENSSTIGTVRQSRPLSCKKTVKLLRSLMQMLVCVPIKHTHEQLMVSLWNPYCAGTFLSYVACFGNLDGGISLVNRGPELRMTLHLFNALRQTQLMQKGQIELLDQLFMIFKGCKAIWEGPRPMKGQFLDSWATASVHSNRIEIEYISKSFRRICLRDYNGMARRLGKRRHRKSDSRHEHLVRVRDTLSVMSDETQLLATNFVCLGFHLHQFCIGLFNELGWMPTVEYAVDQRCLEIKSGRSVGPKKAHSNCTAWSTQYDNFRYDCMAYMLGERVMGALDAGDTMIAARCAYCMVRYFKKVRPETITWFTPHRDDKDEKTCTRPDVCSQRRRLAELDQDANLFPTSVMQQPDFSWTVRQTSSNDIHVEVRVPLD